MAYDWQAENKTGADCSGSSGASNRVLTLANTGLTIQSGFLVYASGLALALSTEYTVVHNTTGTQITFLNPLWDDMTVVLSYLQSTTVGSITDDFTQIRSDFRREVNYYVVTKTTDSLGNETSTFAGPTPVDVVFFEEDVRYIFDKEGLLQVGDAYIMAIPSTGIKRYDKFTIGGETYTIENMIHRYVMGTAVHDFAVCFLID